MDAPERPLYGEFAWVYDAGCGTAAQPHDLACKGYRATKSNPGLGVIRMGSGMQLLNGAEEASCLRKT